MGRRLNVSTPTVINTELVPLDESFYIDVDGQMEQWYYDNTEQYAPNRKVTPLLLVPVISAFDKDTSTSYTPLFNTTQWFANEWNEAQSKYVETEITNQVDSGSADYVIQGNNLLVKKNVSYSHAVSIRCVATYIDPRDRGVTYAVEDSVNLTTNRTADVIFPEVDIISPSGRAYNPLVDDENSQYNFKGVTTNNPVQPLNTDVRRYPVDVDGTEEILNSGEAVVPIMDIRYGNNPTMEDQEFMYRQTAGGTLVGESIDKAFIERIKGNTVAWNQLVRTYNNEVHITGTLDAKSSTNFSSVTFIKGHKYLMRQSGVPSGMYLQSDGVIGLFHLTSDQNYSIQTVSKESFSGSPYLYNWSAGDGAAYDVYLNLFDLTLIYGEGNEPTTVEQFEADYERWFGKPLSYEEYDEGSLRPVLMQYVKTTGFNLWDEEWEEGYLGYRESDMGQPISDSNTWRSKNYIPVTEGQTYYIKHHAVGVHCVWTYDSNKTGLTVITMTNGTNKVVIPSGVKYIKIADDGTTYNNDICINISNPSKNGTYEPYEENVQGFDVTVIKGKLDGAGESVTIFPDGLKKVGNIQDEIFVENGVVKAIKRVGSVDMGTINYTYNSRNTADTGNVFRTQALASLARNESFILSAPFMYHSVQRWESLAPMEFEYVATYLVICHTAATEADLKTALSGVIMYYELATPETYVLDPITDFVWYGIKDGQEVLADTLPWYVSGQGMDNLTVDAMYGENINVVLRCKMMDGETLSPSKAYATLNWRTPDIETFVQSDNGGAVRSDTEEMTFGTIVNVNGDVLSDALKQKHLAFNWKIRKNNTSTETDKGWGQRITIDASDLRNVKGSGSTLASTLVSNEVYLKGAYEEVTDNGEVVTYNGEKVYDRPVD